MVSDNAYNLTAAVDNFEKTFLIFGKVRPDIHMMCQALAGFLKKQHNSMA